MKVECRSNGSASLRLVGETDIERSYIAAMAEACKKSAPPKVRVDGGTAKDFLEGSMIDVVLVVYLEK